MPSKYHYMSPQKTYSKNHMIRTVVWCGSRLRPYPQATRGTFSEARSQSLATLPRRWVGSEGSEIIAHATQKGRRVTTSRTSRRHQKILHLPHKKKVGSPLSPMICTCHTKRRWNHKKCSEASKNIAPATQRERIGSHRTARRQGRNLPQHGTSVTGKFSQCYGDLLGCFYNIAPATQAERIHQELLGAIENSAPATQKASRVTSVAKHFVTSVAKHWVTKYFSEALKILRRPHKVTVNHLRPFPTSMYRVRGQHLRGIEIVAPATQNPCLG